MMFSRIVLVWFVLGLGASSATAGDACLSYRPDPPAVGMNLSTLLFESTQSNSGQGKSSFRGLSLGLTLAETKIAVADLSYSSGSILRSDQAMDICNGTMSVGTVRFDENNRVTKLELRAEYFAVQTVVLHEFADEVFNVNDDICSQDVICFTGVSAASERFIVAKIAGDVRLHVYWEQPK